MKNNIIEKTKILRAQTGISILECKKALLKNNCDIEKSLTYLKEIGMLKASQKLQKIAREGLIGTLISENRKHAIITEINCETDFVSKLHEFKIFINKVNNYFLNNNLNNDNFYYIDNEINIPINISNDRLALINKLGENILIKRIKKISIKDGFISEYVHGTENCGRIATLLITDNFVENYISLYTDIAMQITAMNPKGIYKDNKSSDKLDYEDDSLLEQAFIKDNNLLVKDVILNKFNVIDFIRFEVGENVN